MIKDIEPSLRFRHPEMFGAGRAMAKVNAIVAEIDGLEVSDIGKSAAIVLRARRAYRRMTKGGVSTGSMHKLGARARVGRC